MQIWINNVFYEVHLYYTIFQFCVTKNINLPCFCYHEKLSIAGNCRICLVEVNNALGVSCSLPLLDGMRIFTDNKRVREAREGVLQFLLVNHPLDCPICDQGGECDLQDISSAFGLDRGRFYEYKKRSFDNLNCCGPLIKTVMTRCIHCSRCVRFINEISGVFDLGILGRGSSMEIGTFVEYFLDDELSGNIIDLCPVGALTSMPYAFTARSWELTSVISIDVLDSLASSIRLDTVTNSVVRIVPFLDETVNEEWITNKTRFYYDSFNIQRLNYPKIRLYNKFVIISWGCAFNLFFDFLLNYSFNFFESFSGQFSDIESTFALKSFFNGFGCSNLNYLHDTFLDADFRSQFLLQDTNLWLEKSNLVVFLSSNIRLESPLVNARLRKLFLGLSFLSKFYSLGLALNYLTFPVINLGNTLNSLLNIIESKSIASKNFLIRTFFSLHFFSKISFKFFYSFIKISFFFGSSLLTRFDGSSLFNSFFIFRSLLSSLNDDSIIYPFFLRLGRISSSEVGFIPGINNEFSLNKKNIKGYSFSYFFNTDSLSSYLSTGFKIFQGFFKNDTSSLNNLNLILPTKIFVEQDSFFFNLEGRVRFNKKAITSFKHVLSDLKLLVSFFISRKIFFKSNFSILFDFFFLMSFFLDVIYYDSVFIFSFNSVNFRLFNSDKNQTYFNDLANYSLLNFNLHKIYFNKFYNSLFNRNINNFYSTDSFCKNSKILTLSSLKVPHLNFSKNIF